MRVGKAGHIRLSNTLKPRFGGRRYTAGARYLLPIEIVESWGRGSKGGVHRKYPAQKCRGKGFGQWGGVPGTQVMLNN